MLNILDAAICAKCHMAAMPVVATILSVVILLQVWLHPTQLLLHIAQERIISQNPPVII